MLYGGYILKGLNFRVFRGSNNQHKKRTHKNSVPHIRIKTAHVLEDVIWPHPPVIKVLNVNFSPLKRLLNEAISIITGNCTPLKFTNCTVDYKNQIIIIV